MKLTQRLLLGSLIVVSVLVACVVGVIEYRLNARIADIHTQDLVREARNDVYLFGVVALLVAAAIAFLFSRAVSRPIVELRDVARALAAGDLTRRPSLTAPGEVGDLAIAVHQLAEQLSGRLTALEEEESLLGALLDSLNEGVLAVDARQRIVRINAIGRRLLRVRDQTPFTLDRLPRERVLREALGAALAGTVTESIETSLDGRNLVLAARPLAAGGAVLALLDLTPTRRLETVRRDFVANVSHELRTPLTVVGGFAETLLDDALPSAQRRQFAETILANTRRMQRIVDDLLDLSRIESGGWVPNPISIDVEAAAVDATAAAQAAAEAKGIAFHISIAADAQVAYADPTALRQVLTNLGENAVRHTTSGSVTIFTQAEESGIWVAVRDTGIGISAEHLPRIFERFYRADRARSRDEGGTGLGLAIVRHLVEAHGGTVKAESHPGRGTTVWAFFPSALVVPS
jgi:two-component system, OmpR family, phosphate regulon sensor histidine kinase PhoR